LPLAEATNVVDQQRAAAFSALKNIKRKPKAKTGAKRPKKAA
jgi:hypothetical protein